jgi:hypothetical protein
MELTLTKTPVDIKTLIQNSDISIYDKTRLIQKIEDNFNNDEQKLYISHLFLYLNYHPINDFVINLENVWKFIGFANKGNAKRLLKHHFTENKDYKISFSRLEKLLLRSEKQVNERNTGGSGLNNETIMMNVNTFKKLCLKANTESSDKIHDYYIKLEMMFNDLMKEEIDQHKKRIEKQLEEQKKQLEITEKQLELEKRQKNKLLNRKYYNAKPIIL